MSPERPGPPWLTSSIKYIPQLPHLSDISPSPPTMIESFMLLPKLPSAMQLTFRPCNIHWTCPASRMFSCEFGLFMWHPIFEEKYKELYEERPSVSFAEFLSTAAAEVMMSADGKQVMMLFVKVPDALEPIAMGVEVSQCVQYGGGGEAAMGRA